MLNAYFTQLHPRYPFLDQSEVWALHSERSSTVSMPIQHLSKPQRFGAFKLYMVYAIGAMLLQLTEKHTTSPPEVSITHLTYKTDNERPANLA